MVEHVLPAHSPTVRLTMAQPEVHCTPVFCKTIHQGLKLRFKVKYEKEELTETSSKEDCQIGHPVFSTDLLIYFTNT